MRKYPIVEIEDMAEPFCGVRRRSLISLSEAHPDIAEDWLYEKNAGWGPEDVSRGSGVRCWWTCRFCNRAYKAQICCRTFGGSACPYCASKKICEDNAFVVRFPELAKEWHPTKNKKFKVTEVMHSSNKRVWWLCRACSHAWESTVSDRTGLKSGCPSCYEARMEYARQHPQRTYKPQIILSAESEPSRDWYQKPSSKNFVSLYQFSKKLSREWHPTKNGNTSPRDIAKQSDAIAWWKCAKGADHEWQAAIYSRSGSRKSGCPYCLNRKLSVTNSLAKKAPRLAKEWHPTKNGKLTPKDVLAGGKSLKVWWRCQKDESHEWYADIYRRVAGSGCPDCSHARVSKDNCLNKEFGYIAAELHPTKNGILTGNDIAAMSSKNVWWVCDKGIDHEWLATPANRTARGSGCPFCAGKQISTTTCLATIAPEKSAQWDKKKNGKLTPFMVSPHTKKIVWWRCQKGHSWQQSISKRAKSPVTCWECSGKKPPGVPLKSKLAR